MREKYREISSAVGDGRRTRLALPAASASPSNAVADAVDAAPGSETDVLGRNVAASGVEA